MRGFARKVAWGLLASFVLSVISAPVAAQQCVPYARNNSTIFIRGDAWTWWKGAEGRYAKSNDPEIGSVLVFQKTKKMRRGHVAVIKEVIDSRKVVVDHANWAPRGSRLRGKEAKNIAIIDVSPNNDWTSVRVWFKPLGDFGARTYPTYGFIHDRDANGGKVKNKRYAPAPSLEADAFDNNDDETTLTSSDAASENTGTAVKYDSFGEKSEDVINASYTPSPDSSTPNTPDTTATSNDTGPSVSEPSASSTATDGEMSSEVDRDLADSVVVASLDFSFDQVDIP